MWAAILTPSALQSPPRVFSQPPFRIHIRVERHAIHPQVPAKSPHVGIPTRRYGLSERHLGIGKGELATALPATCSRRLYSRDLAPPTFELG